MATQPTGTSGVALRLAAAAQAAEAVGMGVAAVFAAVSTADGQSYQQASGIALTLIAFGTAAALAALAVGLDRARPWSRTPVVMTQLFVGGAGMYLLIGLTLIAFGTAAALAALAVGLDRARPWSRTPVVMTQLFVGGAGMYLLIGHRWGWGVPALALAAGCLAGLFTPASVRALNRPPRPP